jgi:hypothetical protein
MTQLTNEQKSTLNYTFGVDLDALGTENYSVYHQTNYAVGPIPIYIEGVGQIFSTTMGGMLICLVIHNGNTVIKTEGCQLADGYSPAVGE